MTTPTTNAAAPSLMQALHTRFEATHPEGRAIEAAQANTGQNDYAEQGNLHRALQASEAEADALRYAILTQVPDDWKDGLILAYHVRIEHDFQANVFKPFDRIDPRPSILKNAIDTLFDFMCCETDEDHEAIGPEFRQAATQVFFARRYRTGVVEG